MLGCEVAAPQRLDIRWHLRFAFAPSSVGSQAMHNTSLDVFCHQIFGPLGGNFYTYELRKLSTIYWANRWRWLSHDTQRVAAEGNHVTMTFLILRIGKNNNIQKVLTDKAQRRISMPQILWKFTHISYER